MLHHLYTTTVLRPYFRVHTGEPVPEENFWTSWCRERLTEADTSRPRMRPPHTSSTSRQEHRSPSPARRVPLITVHVPTTYCIMCSASLLHGFLQYLLPPPTTHYYYPLLLLLLLPNYYYYYLLLLPTTHYYYYYYFYFPLDTKYLNFKICSHLCAYHCAQLSSPIYTIQPVVKQVVQPV